MELKKLQDYIRTFATLKETDAPVVSCYLDLSNQVYRDEFDARVRELNKLLTGDSLLNFDQSMRRIEEYIAGETGKTTKKVAIFSRGGREPFFLALDFRVPLPAWITVDRTPNIYHLVVFIHPPLNCGIHF